MRWEITVVASPGHEHFPPTELSLDFSAELSPSEMGSSAAQVLGDLWPDALFLVAGIRLDRLPLNSEPLRQGSVVTVSSDHRRAKRQQEAALGRAPGPYDFSPAQLRITSGPAAGSTFALRRGSYSLGRGACDVSINDPQLSRHHGTLIVSTGGVTLTPAPNVSNIRLYKAWASNPLTSATVLKKTESLRADDLVLCGTTAMMLTLAETPLLPGAQASSAGKPSSSLFSTDSLKDLELTDTGASTRGRTALIAAGLLPLVVGLVFALLTGSWMFLAFAGMGACTLLIPLFSGAKQRRDMGAALLKAVLDAARQRIASFPDAARLLDGATSVYNGPDSAGRSWATQPGSGPNKDVSVLALRIGTQSIRPAVTYSSGQRSTKTPLTHHVPYAIELATGTTSITGPAKTLRSLLALLLMQLDTAEINVVVWASGHDLPLAARFLPRTVLVDSLEAVNLRLAAYQKRTFPERSGEPPTVHHNTVVIHLDTGHPEEISRHPAFVCPVPYIFLTTNTDGDQRGSLSSGHRSFEITDQGVGTDGHQVFVVDGVAPHLFDRYSRLKGLTCNLSPGLQSGSPPGVNCSLAVHQGSTEQDIAATWQANEHLPLQPPIIGQCDSGVVTFDFSADGPHLLVAGTTGSGKSEFLQTLIGGLARLHSPTALSFVLIDFKGGAGLEALVGIPHAVSLVTDLQGNAIARTLSSLRAEIRKRELALSEARCADLQSYRETMAERQRSVPPGSTDSNPDSNLDASSNATLPYLVIAIDEFRVLVDQHPDALAELMRLAAVGRSLGIHLVMATQRPQGAINSDIRANVSSSVCLRVQSAIESQDVIGTAAAAHISPTTPGRAYLARAGQPPLEFQSAALSMPASKSSPRVTLRFAEDALRNTSESPATIQLSPAPTRGSTEAVCKFLHQAWRSSGSAQRPRPVVAPPLPASTTTGGLLTAHFSATEDRSTQRQPQGILDVPAKQELVAFTWLPFSHSHLALLGTPAETAKAADVFLADQLLEIADNKTVQTSLYVLDGGSTLALPSPDSSVVLRLTPDDLRIAARLLELLLNPLSADTPVLLICSDWDKWVTAFRSSPWQWAEDAMHRVLRDSPPHLTVLMSGGRALFGSAMMAEIPNRLFLPHGTSSESTLLWPRLPSGQSYSLRGTLLGPANAAATAESSEQGHVLQLLSPAAPPSGHLLPGHLLPGGLLPGGLLPADVVPGGRTSSSPPVLLKPLPTDLSVEKMLSYRQEESEFSSVPLPGQVSLLLGLGGDEVKPLSVTLRTGTVLPAVMATDSSISAFSAAMTALNPHSYMFPGATTEAVPEPVPGPNPEHPRICLVIAHRLDSTGTAHLNALVAEGNTAVVLMLTPEPQMAYSLPLEWGLRSAQTGMVVAPQRPQDGELLAQRIDTLGREPEGRAVYLDRGNRTWFQYPTAPSAIELVPPRPSAG